MLCGDTRTEVVEHEIRFLTSAIFNFTSVMWTSLLKTEMDGQPFFYMAFARCVNVW